MREEGREEEKHEIMVNLHFQHQRTTISAPYVYLVFIFGKEKFNQPKF